MLGAPFGLEAFDVIIAIGAAAVEAAPRAAPAAEAEGQIAGLPNGTASFVVRCGSVRRRMRDAVTQYGSNLGSPVASKSR